MEIDSYFEFCSLLLNRILNEKTEYYTYWLPWSSNRINMEDIHKWFEDNGHYAIRGIHGKTTNDRHRIVEFQDGVYFHGGYRGGDCVIIFNKDVAIQFGLVFGVRPTHPLAPLIEMKL